MTKSLAHFLTDFGKPAQPFPNLPSFDCDDLVAPADGPDIEEQLAEARRDGYAEGEAAGRASAEADAEALGAEHEAALEAARGRWAAEQGEVLATLLRDGLSALETAVADALAGLMEPVLREAVRAKALEDVREAVRTLLAGDGDALVRITGPADLLDAVEGALASAPGVEFAPDETAVEITVSAGDTTIRSALGPWAERLRSSVAEGV